MMRAEFFREWLFVFATSKRNCLEPHFASVLHTEMSEAATPLHRDDVTGTRSGVAQGINSRPLRLLGVHVDYGQNVKLFEQVYEGRIL